VITPRAEKNLLRLFIFLALLVLLVAFAADEAHGQDFVPINVGGIRMLSPQTGFADQNLTFYSTTYTIDPSNVSRLEWGYVHTLAADFFAIQSNNTGTAQALGLHLRTIGASQISFWTNSTQRWNLSSSGNFLPNTDALLNIGFTTNRVATVYTQALALGNGVETMTNNPRMTWSILIPTVTAAAVNWARIVPDKAITVTSVSVVTQTNAAGCTTSPQFGLSGATVTLPNGTATADSGALSVNFAAGSAISIGVQNVDAGCTTQPANVGVTVQYKMQ
jgi:hypothetical protein